MHLLDFCRLHGVRNSLAESRKTSYDLGMKTTKSSPEKLQKERERYQQKKDHITQITAEYRAANREALRLKAIEYRKENAEKIKERRRLQYLEKKDQIKKNPEQQRKYYQENREKILAAHKKWRSENKEKLRQRGSFYYLKNKEKINERSIEWGKKNPDKRKAASAEWRQRNLVEARKKDAEWRRNNRDKARASCAAWEKKNPELVRVIKQNRRARIAQSQGKLSKGLVEKLLKLQKGRCACCKLPLNDDYHLDHIMPLALGGTNTDDNIQLLRSLCNQRKHAKHPVDYMQEKGYLL